MISQPSSPTPEPRPIDARLFSFHGFGGKTGGARRRLNEARVRGGEPGVAILEQPTFVPDEDRRHFRSGPDHDDPPPEPARGHNQPGPIPGILSADDPQAASLDEKDIRTLDEEVVYLGRLYSSYGHFLLESLSTTWFLTQVDPSVRVVFHLPPGSRGRSRAWATPILAAFGIPRDRIIPLDQPIRVRRAYVPEPLFSAKHSAHERAAEPYQAVAARIMAGSLQPSSQPVYLSRRLLASPERLTIGEADLEDILRENGFLVAHPETMTFEDQVRLFNQHTDFFSGAGSAAHNVLFSLHRPRLHVLTSGGQISPNFFLCSALVESPTAFVKCLDTGDRSPGRGRIAVRRRLPEIIDLPTLVEYLDERGLLKSRIRARLAGRDPALRRTYDEAWLYARVRAAWSDGTLPRPVIKEATAIARGSWPVSLALARYVARRNANLLEEMADQFATLAAIEVDTNRLARYRTDVEESLRVIRRHCRPETAQRLTEVAGSAFLLDLQDRKARRSDAARRDHLERPGRRQPRSPGRRRTPQLD